MQEAALEAGKVAMSYFGKDPQVWMKAWDSPVSDGVVAVNAFLEKTLQSARPNYGWLSEETADTGDRMVKSRTFIVDPIDGTRAYIGGRETWCVSIALVENGRPIAGVLEWPALGESVAAAKGNGATLNGRSMTAVVHNKTQPVAGPLMMRRAMERVNVLDYALYPDHIPSLAYRLAMVAKGDLSAAFARPRCHDWDIAAADILLEEVGAALHDVRGADQSTAAIYNQTDLKRSVLLAAANSAPQHLMEVAQSMVIHQ